MATKKPKAVSDKALSADEGVTTPRLKLGETGFVGLKMSNGQILQEAQRAFRYPHFIKVIDEIRANPTVAASMTVYRFMICRKKWRVDANEYASEITKERAELINTMLMDMEGSFESFISNVVSYLEYGFCVQEIVPYRRLKRNGSKYNDGLIGIKKLAIRNQDTIARWDFSEDGRELLGVSQNIANIENSFRYQALKDENGLIPIPRDKFLLFTASGSAGNPQGNSIYKTVYLSHKQLTGLQEQELLTIAKEAKGTMCIQIPAQYLQGEDAPDGGAAAEGFKTIIDNWNNGTASGLLVPQQIDQESKLPMFSYGLLESKGTPAINVEDVIKRLQKDIWIALQTDILALGTDGSGSFALASEKNSILALAIDFRCKEIQDTLNRELITYIYKMNGWDTSEMPEFKYSDEEDIELETFSSAIQRIVAVDGLEMDREAYNIIRKALGLKEKPEDTPVNKDELPSNMGSMASRSGDSKSVGKTGQGTSDIGGNSDSTDKSVANKEN